MSCVSKKVCYNTEEEVKEALISSRVRYAKGAVGFYLCDHCGLYHLTSKGVKHTSITSKDTQKKIEKDREVQHWEDKFKGR